jgi:ATP-binding cassette subfamily B protein
MSRVSNDVDTIGQTLQQSFSALVRALIMLAGVLIAMFLTSWEMALAAIVTVPVSMILMMIIVKFSQKFHREQAKQLGILNGIVEENYSAQAIVKAFNGQEKAQEDFDSVNDKLSKASKKSSFLSMGIMMPIMGFVGNLGFVVVCVVGGLLMAKAPDNEKATILGMMSSFLIYLRLFQNPLTEIAQSVGNLQSTAAASERVFEFLDEREQKNESAKTRFDVAATRGKVEFRNVRFGYNEMDKVKDLSVTVKTKNGINSLKYIFDEFLRGNNGEIKEPLEIDGHRFENKLTIKEFSATVNPGQKVAIVGPTGAGKTTMVNLLMRFYEINNGEIFIDDVPIHTMRREDVRSLFGMVLQDSWLFEGTIKENIIYAKESVTDEEVKAACKAANIDHYIRTLPAGYDTVLSDEVNISSGQRQLLTIARAIVQNSPMLILDEATSNVDTRTEQLIQDAMDNATGGRTSFVIAHRLSTIKNANLILVMKEGDIIESGTHEQLLKKNGFYAELYNSQFSEEAE